MFTRRELLPLFALPALSFLPTVDAIANERVGKKENNEKAVIIIPLTGGPSQIDTFDIHEDAPTEFRPFGGFIKTNVEGICVGSHFVNIAKNMDKCSIINGISHNDNSHDSGFHAAMTGYNTPSGDMVPQKEPAYGAVLSRFFSPNGKNGIPTYVTSERLRHTGPAWLGIKNESFAVTEEGVNNLKLNITNDRFSDRLGFIKAIELSNKLDKNELMKGWSDLRGLAGDVVKGSAAKSFMVELESDKMKERYGVGKSDFGKNLLLARRLIQGGTKIVVVPKHNWDTHVNLLQTFSTNAVELDLYVSVLLEDLIERGMYKNVLVILTGEFGRTPRKNQTLGNDHWANSMSSLMLGGNYSHGKRVGLTSKDTAISVGKPITHMDIFATILNHMGIDEKLTITDFSQRPHHILTGEYKNLL